MNFPILSTIIFIPLLGAAFIFLSSQKVTLNNKTKSLENIKDIWTFEKDMTTKSLVWKLVEVGTD